MARAPFTLTAYRYATAAVAPAVPLFLRGRASRGKEDLSRMNERLGRGTRARPDGELIWLHGASVGESLATLPLIAALKDKGHRQFLVTTGTVTSAELMAERLPDGAFHQFMPIDTPAATGRFLDHWRPSIGLFVDSDLWPNMLTGAQHRGIPLALVNARISERSFKGWQRAPKTMRTLLSTFDICLAQDEEIAGRLTTLGAPHVRNVGSLKADAPPLPADPERLAALSAAIGGRPVLLASQTHPGEDETILPAHDILRQRFPDLLTIIVPRHRERGADIAMLCGTRKAKQRSQSKLPDTSTAIYIADTMGELGLFYRLAPFTFIGGSLIPHGGQNPLEPARLHCAVMAGPNTFNFTSVYEAVFKAQGEGLVGTAAGIAEFAGRMLGDPAKAKAAGEAAFAGAETLGGAVAKTCSAVEAILASHARA
ncbi:MAG TPA: 3-deoxy-D-manno-octulosonic acid transferase [Rhizomicrobium sp.]|jgi:3-deoxy-D-manno-octulosonic-acid transferase